MGGQQNIKEAGGNVNTQTSWLTPPYHSKGLDPLGIQAPSINIYGQLLPGITNVTDRARYYSFYPWMIRAFEETSSKKSYENLREWVRRSDCLFTLIGLRHGQQTPGESSAHIRALIGSNTLTPIIQDLENDSAIDLSRFTHLGDSPHRYFKNQLGGLRQYYIGTFDSLGLMTRKGRSVANTIEVGVPMAEAMDSFVNGELFIETVNSGKVTASVLDGLVGFCPCQISASEAEQAALLDLFFARNDFDNESGRQRRNTLGVLLSLIDDMASHKPAGTQFSQDVFRGCVYSGAMPDGSSWALPSDLAFVQNQWKVYQRHELLSAAIQSIFWVALKMIYNSGENLWGTEDFISWFSSQPAIRRAATSLGGESYSSAEVKAKALMPDFQNWLDENHEVQLAHSVLEVCAQNTDGDESLILEQAGRIILTLLVRDDMGPEPYSPLHFPEDFYNLYPLNLVNLKQLSDSTWRELDAANWLAWVAGHWCIEAHFRVALRKLRYQNKDTLHVLPTDLGLVVQEMPSPTYTTPRFNQGVQILEDLGAIQKEDDGSMILTPLGQTLKGEFHA